jgi:para-nitrobenzyl esterase
MKMRWARPHLAVAVVTAAALGLTGCGGTTQIAHMISGVHTGAAAGSTLVTTNSGAVQGASSGGIVSFLGIPYAAPPSGALRFAAPQARAAWTTTLQATSYGPRCPQIGRGGVGTQTATEDCLYLNIWEPSSGSNLPVYMFIHGGGFSGGSGADYNGSWLAAQGVIVVTINYRLGIFGYLADTALDTGGGNTGNYGLEDQQFALKWIQANIAAFGGNPNNVTLGGESAGAMSTCENLASPNAKGLFARAIVESGPCTVNWQSLSTAEATGSSLAASLGCTGTSSAVAACLRTQTISQLLTVQNSAPPTGLFPSAGGSDIPVQPRTVLGKVPLLLGGNNLELGIGGTNTSMTQAMYDSNALATYGSPDATFIEAEYTVPPYTNYGSMWVHTETDFDPSPGAIQITFCEDVATWTLDTTNGGTIYAYEFNDPNAPSGTAGAPEGPVHTSELQYLFPLASGGPTQDVPLSADSATLSTAMVSYWTNFMKTGNPNGSGLATWSAYSGPTTAMQLVPDAVEAGTDTNGEHHCSFWNGINGALSSSRR